QGGGVPQRGGLAILPLLRDEQAAGTAEVIVLVQRKRRPVERVARAGRAWVAPGDIAVQVRSAGVVATVERLVRRAPQRVGPVRGRRDSPSGAAAARCVVPVPG